MNRKQTAAVATPLVLVAALFVGPALFAPADYSAKTPAAGHTAPHAEDPHHTPTGIAEAAYEKHRPAAGTATGPGTAAPIPTGTAVAINGRNYVPCITEDYEGEDSCYWDAGARSSGSGLSFLYDGDGTTYLTAGLDPCEEEDYEGPDACFWDGGTTGRSFVWTGTEVLFNVG